MQEDKRGLLEKEELCRELPFEVLYLRSNRRFEAKKNTFFKISREAIIFQILIDIFQCK